MLFIRSQILVRMLFAVLFTLSLNIFLAASVAAGPNFLPRLPRINFGKAVKAAAYPVTKSLINGGKTVLKVGETADKAGLVPNIGPPAVSSVVKKTLWGVGRH